LQRVCVQEADFSTDEVYRSMRAALGPSVGAIVSFVGLVRDRNLDAGDGSEVATLTLEHYPGMTEQSIVAILDQAQTRWPLLSTHVTHRVGTMAPTEQIVLVMVASAHREVAFAAAQFIMDYLKTDAVFWKRELTENSEQWVQSTRGDISRAKTWSEEAEDV